MLEDIIKIILEFTNIKCSVCQKKFSIKDKKFYLDKFSKKYYCSNKCYNFI